LRIKYNGTMETEYRTVPGFDAYRCGADGSVWSHKVGGKWKQLRPRANPRGQLRVVLRRNNAAHDFIIGRLMLMSFVGPCPDGMECLHYDDNPANNRLSNLRWGTQKENGQDALRNNKFTQVGENHHGAKLTKAQVEEIRRCRAAGLSAQAIANMFGVSRPNVSKIYRGKSWMTST
jgi:hypothetical protein